MGWGKGGGGETVRHPESGARGCGCGFIGPVAVPRVYVRQPGGYGPLRALRDTKAGDHTDAGGGGGRRYRVCAGDQGDLQPSSEALLGERGWFGPGS